MAEAIIFDDGGSTRIKRVMSGTAVGAMDSLLDVDDLGAGKKGSGHTINDTYTTLLILIQDKFGKPFQINDSSFTTVEISSGLAQEIVADTTSGSLKVTVFSRDQRPDRGIQAAQEEAALRRLELRLDREDRRRWRHRVVQPEAG